MAPLVRTRAMRSRVATGKATKGVASRGTGSSTPPEISGHYTHSPNDANAREREGGRTPKDVSIMALTLSAHRPCMHSRATYGLDIVARTSLLLLLLSLLQLLKKNGPPLTHLRLLGLKASPLALAPARGQPPVGRARQRLQRLPGRQQCFLLRPSHPIHPA